MNSYILTFINTHGVAFEYATGEAAPMSDFDYIKYALDRGCILVDMKSAASIPEPRDSPE